MHLVQLHPLHNFPISNDLLIFERDASSNIEDVKIQIVELEEQRIFLLMKKEKRRVAEIFQK